MRSLIFIPLFTVDKAVACEQALGSFRGKKCRPKACSQANKAGKFLPSHTPSFNNLSRISLPNMLGFINLNNSMDSRTLSESLEGFLLSPSTKTKICAVRLIVTNDATHFAISNTSRWWDFSRSLSAQIQINYPFSDFRTERFTLPLNSRSKPLQSIGLNIAKIR